jgi:transposase
LSNGELYTIIANKYAKGKKGSIIAIIKGTKSKDIVEILMKIPMEGRLKVKEVTMNMSQSFNWAVRQCFLHSVIITDRFHVQQLVSDALQEVRIKERWKAIEEENNLVKEAKEKKEKYRPLTYKNGDTKKQLLARSRYLLFKPSSKWTESQKERRNILFQEFPDIKKAYELSMLFRNFYESKSEQQASKLLHIWYQKVEKYQKKFPAFLTAMNSIKHHAPDIFNYFRCNRTTNANAESFNAKIKCFRGLVRGVTDKKFFLFRIAKLFA